MDKIAQTHDKFGVKGTEALTQLFTEKTSGFEAWLAQFLVQAGLIQEHTDLTSPRFLNRSILPHAKRLSEIFNRQDETATLDAEASFALARYWKTGSNPKHLMLAYFLYFGLPNAYRLAAIWGELSGLGFRWPGKTDLHGIDWGAGTGSATLGLAFAESILKTNLPPSGKWALIEQDRSILKFGTTLLQAAMERNALQWQIKTFSRQIDFSKPLLPPAAPRFNLWTMSFFLNEIDEKPFNIARKLAESWDRHLQDESMILIVEPALQTASRRLLEVRKALLELKEENARYRDYHILLPCLGHQPCGALIKPEDWCHEEVSWWRPSFIKYLDDELRLDHKKLSFSYLVLAKTKRSRAEWLPGLKNDNAYRIVSGVHYHGKTPEFHLCGDFGKKIARPGFPCEKGDLKRGTIFTNPTFEKDKSYWRIAKTDYPTSS